MHAIRTLVLAGLAMAPLSATQAIELSDEFALNITPTLVSDYRASGISQTQNDPAAQLNVMLSHASGAYAGLWTSNVDFGLDYRTRQEIEYYAGYYWQINDDISLDTWVTRYEYPNTSSFNMNDVQTVLDAYGAQLGFKYASNMHDLELNEEEDFSAWFVGYHTELPLEIGLSAKLENVDYKDDVFWSKSGKAREDYDNWEIKLSKTLFDLDWALSYVDTDLSETECLSFMGYKDVCSATVVAAVSKSF